MKIYCTNYENNHKKKLNKNKINMQPGHYNNNLLEYFILKFVCKNRSCNYFDSYKCFQF